MLNKKSIKEENNIYTLPSSNWRCNDVNKKVGKSWTFRIEAGTDPKTGKRKQVYRSGFKTRREAHEEMIKIQKEITEGHFIFH